MSDEGKKTAQETETKEELSGEKIEEKDLEKVTGGRMGKGHSEPNTPGV
jgi:hypothetical protein